MTAWDFVQLHWIELSAVITGIVTCVTITARAIWYYVLAPIGEWAKVLIERLANAHAAYLEKTTTCIEQNTETLAKLESLSDDQKKNLELASHSLELLHFKIQTVTESVTEAIYVVGEHQPAAKQSLDRVASKLNGGGKHTNGKQTNGEI